MRTIVAPVLEQQEQFKKSLQPIIESQHALQKVLEPILAQHEQLKSIVGAIVVPKIALSDSLIKRAEEFKKSIEGLVSPAFQQIQKSFRELPARTQEALILLGTYGWYLDLKMSLPEVWELKKALAEGNVTEAEDALAEYFEGRVNEIERSIIDKFPKRQKLLSAAFNAHRRQEYELSIPVFLAQTDGICKEVINQYLFLKHNKKPRTARYVEQIASDTYRAALLSPLAAILPIGASERERDQGFRGLNRHTVLHGESLDYGTKTNSLKAISLINYVAHVLTYKAVDASKAD